MRAGESGPSFDMSCYYPWGFLFLVLCLLQSMIYMSCGCSVEERAALMDIRSSLMRANSTVLPSWGRGEDCCSWEHVKCNNSTWRVSHLYLSNLYEPSYKHRWRAEHGWRINSMVFSAFHELQFLDLSENYPISLSFDGLAGLTKLQYLNLSCNWLEVLYLNSNPTSEALPDAAFKNLQNLRILDLSGNEFNGSLPMSLFALPHLKILDISRNTLGGRIPISSSPEPVSLEVLDLSYNIMSGALPTDQAFENLQNLRKLDLSRNYFNGSLPMSLFALPHLKILNLSENSLGGRIPISSSSEPVSLEVLDLGYNRLSGALPTDQAFKNLQNMRILDLSGNEFNGSLPMSLFALPHLKILDLSGNSLGGRIPISSSSEPVSLEVLDLSDNRLSGALPTDQAFENLRNLRELDFSYNLFSGNLPTSLFSLPQIEVLDLSRNLLEGPIPISSSSNISLSLKSLLFSQNNLSGRISFYWLRNLMRLEEIDLSGNTDLVVDVNVPGWVPLFQLKQLALSGCDIDKGIIAEPYFLRTQHHLEELDLSNNNLSGSMPNWLFTKEATLRTLNLGNNSLTGSLDPIWYPQTSLSSIDISMNRIAGQLPDNISSMFPTLPDLDFSDNIISGYIPRSLCHIAYMEYLDLSNNKFSGELPACVFSDLPKLSTLKVSNNQLGGLIFGGMNNLSTELEIMYLDSNKFEGTLPRNLSAAFLSVMDLQDNKLSGNLDTSFWDLPFLWVLNLAGNRIIGEIHPKVCGLHNIVLLDLSNNNLEGSIPNCSGTTLRFLYVSGNSLYGDIPNAFLNSSNVIALDLRYNQLTGNLDWIQYLDGISLLALGGNKFEGQITPKMCRLESLRIIDLSHNSLSGSLPPCVGDIPFNYVYDEDFWLLDEVINRTYYSYIAYQQNIYDLEGFAFSTKGNLYTYRRSFLSSMSGIDLSGNSLSGEIPWELGNLSHIKALNLSYNFFTGPIPASFANMSEIESMDLSHNKLSGQIPWQLTQLSSLEVFSVAYNNLSGCAPNTGQFGSFDMDSYKGNNNLQKASQGGRCTSRSRPGSLTPEDTETKEDDPVLYAVSAASFVLTFWATVAFVFCHSSGQRVILKL